MALRSSRASRIFVALLASGSLGCASAGGGRPAPTTGQPADGRIELVAIEGARSPLPGIVTGGTPSEAQLREAHALGYRGVLSLLSPAEHAAEAELVRKLGMHFISIPVAGEPDLTEENARKLGDVLAAPQAYPLILHCSSGNRAGALLALYAFYVHGASTQQALEVGEAAGLTQLRPAVLAHLQAQSAKETD